LHSDSWPKCTSRDTTAAAFLSEAGISPTSVDRVFLVLRCHPIRVAGDSGPLPLETTWDQIANSAGANRDLREFTSVTQKLRRVANFDAELVGRAVIANGPTDIVLNHIDYIDAAVYETSELSPVANEFVTQVERKLSQRVNWVGTGERSMFELLPSYA